MNLKEKIQEKFIEAMKSKDSVAKSALGMVKAEITKAEKANLNESLTDYETVKVIMNLAKQRRQSIDEFKNAKRIDLVEKETAELAILEEYLPKQLTREEIVKNIREILEELGSLPNKQMKVGKTIGAFNKKFVGQADVKIVKEVAEELA